MCSAWVGLLWKLMEQWETCLGWSVWVGLSDRVHLIMCHLSSLCELQGTCMSHVVAALTQVLTRVEKFCPSLSLRHESLKVFSEYLSVCCAMMKRLQCMLGQPLCTVGTWNCD